MNRVGDWIQVYTGRKFWPLDPRPSDIFIEDIAHALSMKCRYSGHCERFYSVAEHSIIVSQNVSPENRLAALLHDASEAYLADVPRPIKPFLPGYFEIEEKVDSAIAERFGVQFPWPDEVQHIDWLMLSYEKNELLKDGLEWSGMPKEILNLNCALPIFETPGRAETAFLHEFKELTKRKAVA